MRRAAFRKLWAWPLALGLLSGSGLASALVSDAAGDVWAWCVLSLPLLVILFCLLRGR